MSRRRGGALWALAALGLAPAAGAAAASAAPAIASRNPHHFTFEFILDDPAKGSLSQGGVFTLSACRQANCFHISGPLKLPSNEGGLAEGSFSIPEADCELHFLEVPRHGMDSADLRVTPIASDQAGKGCDYLPAGLRGLYRY